MGDPALFFFFFTMYFLSFCLSVYSVELHSSVLFSFSKPEIDLLLRIVASRGFGLSFYERRQYLPYFSPRFLFFPTCSESSSTKLSLLGVLSAYDSLPFRKMTLKPGGHGCLLDSDSLFGFLFFWPEVLLFFSSCPVASTRS